MEVFQFVEFFHGYQVILKCLDLGSKVLSNFQYGFITGKEVEKLVAKYVDASEFLK